jgi:hypothetical protein
MHRQGGFTAVACATALGVACVGAAGGDAASPPVLGAKAYAPNGTGFGTAHPKQFHNGGDPSGLVTHIAWKRWGTSSASGTGKNALFKPEGGYYATPATIKLKAYDLGTCPGSKRRAYRRLKYRVPDKPGGELGPWRSWSGPGTICKAPA